MDDKDIDGIAVTVGPGLVGSLLVGVSYAKAMAFALNKPFVGVNHIEGHIYSVAFENPPVEYPALALVVSGGHTNIFHIPQPASTRWWRAPVTMPPAKRSTRSQRCLGWAIPVGQSSNDWRAKESKSGSIRDSANGRRLAGFQFQRIENCGYETCA